MKSFVICFFLCVLCVATAYGDEVEKKYKIGFINSGATIIEADCMYRYLKSRTSRAAVAFVTSNIYSKSMKETNLIRELMKETYGMSESDLDLITKIQTEGVFHCLKK